jgi:hypothetical protein
MGGDERKQWLKWLMGENVDHENNKDYRQNAVHVEWMKLLQNAGTDEYPGKDIVQQT